MDRCKSGILINMRNDSAPNKHALLVAELDHYGLDGVIVSHLPTVRWVTGFVSSRAVVYANHQAIHLFADRRYGAQVRQIDTAEPHVVMDGRSLVGVVAKEMVAPGQLIGYQEDHLDASELNLLRELLGEPSLVALTNVFKEAIAHKSPMELEYIEQAQAITDKAFSEVLGFIRPGVTEKELAAEIIHQQLRLGADGLPPDFWPLVAFGERSALPHSYPSDRKLANGEVALFDFGCMVNGYSSDMSRTIVCGEADQKVQRVYELVLRAQTTALEAARAGVGAKELDELARDIIAKAGYSPFEYSLGHGVGMDVHEWPIIGPRAGKDLLPLGAVVAIEPGIHIPGEFGVRIEDMVVIGEKGVRNLTKSPKNLISV